LASDPGTPRAAQQRPRRARHDGSATARAVMLGRSTRGRVTTSDGRLETDLAVTTVGTIFTASPNSSRTCSPGRHSGRTVRHGRQFRCRRRQQLLGDRVARHAHRDAVLPSVIARSTAGARRRTSVSGPGQNRAAQRLGGGGTWRAQRSSSRGYRGARSAGASAGRPFSSNTLRTASGFCASAPSPYTVSVGRR